MESHGDQSVTTTVVSVPAPPGHGGEGPGLLDVSGRMLGLTWIAFGVTAAILHRVAWKPILRALEARESSIQKALDDAARAREETSRLEARSRDILREAEARSEALLASARTSAAELAERIEREARDEGRRMVTEARRRIQADADKARAALREESAGLAVSIAGRILARELDAARHEELARTWAEEIRP